MKVAPDEVDRVGHSVLLSHSTQQVLSLATTLSQGTGHSDKPIKAVPPDQATFAALTNESIQGFSVICDVLNNGGLSITEAVRSFLVEGLSLGDNSSSLTGITAPTVDVTTTLCSAAHSDIMTLRNLLRQYDIYLSTVRDLYMVVACLLDMISSFLATNSSAAKATAARVADTVQDIENDASPVKSRTLAENDDFSIGVCALLDKLLSLEAVLVDLIELHPVPYLITVEDWVKSLCTINTLPPALQALQQSFQRYTSSQTTCGIKPTTQFTDYESTISKHLNAINQAVATHIDYAVQAQVDFYAQSAIENILRQEWTSHSKYLRDKKFTHGIVALCTGIRQSVFEIYQQYSSHMRSSVGYCAKLSAQSNNLSAFCLQMLLSMAVLVSRTYLGYHLSTEESTQSSAENNADPTNPTAAPTTATDKNQTPLLDISRVRTAQWLKDQHYFVYMILETVVWILTQDIIIQSVAAIDGEATNRSSTVQMEGHTQIKQLLQSEPFAVHVGVLSELVLVVKYLLLSLYISSGNAEEVLGTLSTALSNVSSTARDVNDSREVGQANSGVYVWQQFVQLLQSLSTGDTLLDYVNSSTSTTRTDTVSTEEINIVPVLTPLDRAFLLFEDMHSHTGLYSFHIHPENVEEIALYKKELQVFSPDIPAAATTTAAAQRAVILHRIATMQTKGVNLLLVVLATDNDRFCELHSAIHSTAPVRDPADSVRGFVRFSLLRRYEINPATYPPLTAGEAESAVRIKAFLDSM